MSRGETGQRLQSHQDFTDTAENSFEGKNGDTLDGM